MRKRMEKAQPSVWHIGSNDGEEEALGKDECAWDTKEHRTRARWGQEMASELRQAAFSCVSSFSSLGRTILACSTEAFLAM